jgi:hypothetical protein
MSTFDPTPYFSFRPPTTASSADPKTYRFVVDESGTVQYGQNGPVFMPDKYRRYLEQAGAVQAMGQQPQQFPAQMPPQLMLQAPPTQDQFMPQQPPMMAQPPQR